jgi:hypothetical protein
VTLPITACSFHPSGGAEGPVTLRVGEKTHDGRLITGISGGDPLVISFKDGPPLSVSAGRVHMVERGHSA